MERNEPTSLREFVKQHGTQPTTPSAFLTEAIQACNVMTAEAVEQIRQLEQQLVQAQRAADVVGDRLTAVEVENRRCGRC